MNPLSPLSQLHSDIDARVHAIRENRPDWLCGKGCDSCCRRLAAVPQLTAAEWALLKEGLATLAPQYRAEIGRNLAALAGPQSGPVVCPLLDRASGACPVYAQRPVACRTYGFYVQRDLGLYCHDIEARVADGTLADVVWGNHDAIDQRLAGLGESRALTEWFALEENGSIEAEVREILAIAAKPEARVRMGDALAALGRTIGLTNTDVEAFDQARDQTPTEPPRLE